MKRPSEDEVLAVLRRRAAELAGFAEEAILPEVIRRLVRRMTERGARHAALLEQAARGDTELLLALRRAVAVGETYFFRHPEHFRFLSERVLPHWEGRAVRGLSAGCATGEEAYSLAACLAARLSSVQVVGVDVHEDTLEAARRGEYGPWSVRSSAPLLHPLFEAPAQAPLRIEARLRDRVRFAAHDLLEPLPASLGVFDVVLCRNVLMYFSPDAAARAVANLLAVLAPDGVVVFGTMDVDRAPDGFEQVGPAGIQAFARPAMAARIVGRRCELPRTMPRPPVPRRRSWAPRGALRSVPPQAAAPTALERAVALHLQALGHVERGERREAGRLLERLGRDAPDYVPGLLERALLLAREGRSALAADLMRRVLELLETVSDDEQLAAPEALPVSFYRASARAFLRTHGGER